MDPWDYIQMNNALGFGEVEGFTDFPPAMKIYGSGAGPIWI
jgi:hypothetical protein